MTPDDEFIEELMKAILAPIDTDGTSTGCFRVGPLTEEELEDTRKRLDEVTGTGYLEYPDTIEGFK